MLHSNAIWTSFPVLANSLTTDSTKTANAVHCSSQRVPLEGKKIQKILYLSVYLPDIKHICRNRLQSFFVRLKINHCVYLTRIKVDGGLILERIGLQESLYSKVVAKF